MGRILVVRTEPTATETSRALVRLGHEAYPCPLLKIVPAPLTKKQKRLLHTWSDFDAVIIVSGHAARSFIQQCLADRQDPNKKGSKQPQFFALGPMSAAPLQEASLPCRAPQTDFRTEGLLALSEMQNLTGRRVLILRGRGGDSRTRLDETLAQRGAQVYSICLYERKPNDQAITRLTRQLQTTWDAVLVGSGNLLQIMAKTSVNKRISCPLLVPSSRVMQIAETLSFSSIVNLRTLSPESLHRWLQQGTR